MTRDHPHRDGDTPPTAHRPAAALPASGILTAHHLHQDRIGIDLQFIGPDEANAVALDLCAGEMSLHHVRLVHGSDLNPSPRRRLGFAIRYLPTYLRQTVATRDSATLVRGVDRFGNFAPEQRPAADLDGAALAHHADITGRLSFVLLRGAGLTM